MANKVKVRPEEKIKIVKEYVQGGISLSEAARRAGTSIDSVRMWIAHYESEGVEGLLPSGKNRVYSTELKQAAVLEYLSGTDSLNAICRKHKIKSRDQLRKWIKVYNAHGDINSVKHSGGGSYMKQGRNTTQEERVQIAKECISAGKNYGEIALKYLVSYQQVRIWTLRFEELGEKGLEDRRGQRKKSQEPRTELERLQIENEQLKHQLYLAEMEAALLKKLDEVERRDAFRK